MSYGYRCKNCGLVGVNKSHEDDVIRAVFICDQCGVLAGTSVYTAPLGWLTVDVEEGDRDEYTPQEHYCSRACLRKHEVAHDPA